MAKAWDSARRAFGQKAVSLQSWTPDFRKLVLKVEGEEDAGTYFLVDLETKKADLLADAWPGVPPEAIAPVRFLTYKAADGLDIPAYLTTPAGRPAKGLPLIVLPHGGPQARDEPGFDWWSQALASRGYAVLQPQFRGSDGFGRKFVEAGYGQWGRKMQTDLSDGVRHLAKEGVIDPKRVCIMGASYGGYAAMAGPTLDRGVYRCAVAVAGVGDLAGMLAAEAKDAGRVNTGAVRYWSKFMGASFRKRSELDAVSPTHQAAQADAPILVIHGKDDTVVPYNQSVQFVRAMQAAGKPVEFVTLAGEDHWLSRGATRLKMLESAVAFVEKHNPSQ
jgi:dipeptidyl aminopeptidase/acylaminoacyl peptidase